MSQPASRLAGKVALVTGGSRGIGAAIVERLAAEGAAVAFTYATFPDRAQAIADRFAASGHPILVLPADSGDPDAVTSAVARTHDALGRLDILVNSAGVTLHTPVAEVSVAEYDRLLAVNVRAVFLAAQAAAKVMPDGGRIISIGSNLADRIPFPGLTRGLARDLGPRGITVNLVQPGSTDTDMNPAAGAVAWRRTCAMAKEMAWGQPTAPRSAIPLSGSNGRRLRDSAFVMANQGAKC